MLRLRWRRDGRCCSAAQIRELMGSVPNAVFERLLEAVAAGQSAELMEQLNLLVNAGHSPSSLARQMVRYLRNALMAKLGGEQTELLQISGDERARAARTALLFTEEELTRNLQIVLRTFDDLNYRQEQRFHLELGLLKLIHAQRLLPLEELLSGVAAGGGFRIAGGAAGARPAGRADSSRRGACGSARPRLLLLGDRRLLSLSPFGAGGGGCSRGRRWRRALRQDRWLRLSGRCELRLLRRLSANGRPAVCGESPFPASGNRGQRDTRSTRDRDGGRFGQGSRSSCRSCRRAEHGISASRRRLGAG